MCRSSYSGNDSISSSVDSEAIVSNIDIHKVEARVASATDRYRRIGGNCRLHRLLVCTISATSSSRTQFDLS
jgi:hypothetical protein